MLTTFQGDDYDVQIFFRLSFNMFYLSKNKARGKNGEVFINFCELHLVTGKNIDCIRTEMCSLIFDTGVTWGICCDILHYSVQLQLITIFSPF